MLPSQPIAVDGSMILSLTCAAVHQVVAVADVNQNPQARDWRKAAEYHWKQPNHPGWQIMNEPLVRQHQDVVAWKHVEVL